MLGYYNKPAVTVRVINSEGWLHTGDLCSLGADGYLRHHGRLKEVIIRGGENIAAREVEDVIFGRADVADVAVVGVPDPKYGEVVVAFTPRSHTPCALAWEVIEYCRERLVRHKCPVAVWVVDEFPLTASGKVKNFELREWHCLHAG